MNRWLVAAPLSVALGALFTALGVPASWILGGIVGAGSVALLSGRDLPINEHLFTFARGTVGVFAAIPLVGTAPRELLSFLIPGLVMSAAVLGLAFLGGMWLGNHGVSRETGILSQYLRLLIVSMTLPLVASLVDAPSAHTPSTTCLLYTSDAADE